jgi:hypothetical protein
VKREGRRRCFRRGHKASSGSGDASTFACTWRSVKSETATRTFPSTRLEHGDLGRWEVKSSRKRIRMSHRREPVTLTQH